MRLSETSRIHWNIAFLLAIVTAISCEDSQPVAEVGSVGSVNFTSYVSLGNSLTAGFQSNALYASAQQYSYPNLIAAQVRQTGVSLTFTQPLLMDPGIGGRMKILRLSPLTISSDPVGDPTNPAIYVSQNLFGKPYTNLAIPGARVYNKYTLKNDVLDTLNSFTKSFSPSYGQNPFYHLVLRNPVNVGSVWQQAKILNPTFITVWLGNNDVLGYATSGGLDPITATTSFTAAFNAMIDSLKSTGAKLVLGTIPDVTSIPFFTTIKWFIPDPADPTKPIFGTLIPLRGRKSDGSVGVLGPNDFVLLTAADSLASGYGLPADPIFSSFPNAGKPLGNQFILDSAEVAAARNATSAFNAIIRSHADANTAVVDVFAIFNEISAKGLTIAGQTFSTAYISGGLFTLDGVHPTSQAHGIIANEFIRTINAKWGASIPFVNVLSLPGLPIPLSKQQASWRLQDIPANAIREAAKIWR